MVRLLLGLTILFGLLVALSFGILSALSALCLWILGKTPFQLGGTEVLLGAILLALLWEQATQSEREYLEREKSPEYQAVRRWQEIFTRRLR